MPPHILARQRHEATTNAYEAGTLSPYRRFTYLQSDSEESYKSGWRGEPMPFMPDSKIQETPTAESTRVPLKTSTEKREAKEQKEPLTPDQLLEMEQTILYKKKS